MLGQPPTALSSASDDVSDADPYFEKVWEKVRDEDFADVILRDGLDTKDGLLMKGIIVFCASSSTEIYATSPRNA